MAQGSRPPDKERVRSRLPAGCCSSGSLNACRVAAAGAGRKGSPGISGPRGTGKRASPTSGSTHLSTAPVHYKTSSNAAHNRTQQECERLD
ncbi:hypothetical protein A6R68_02728, partial [Neotoma lepida]